MAATQSIAGGVVCLATNEERFDYLASCLQALINEPFFPIVRDLVKIIVPNKTRCRPSAPNRLLADTALRNEGIGSACWRGHLRFPCAPKLLPL
jgi:hypothetical protein